MNNSSKWACSQCTYQNFGNAIRCTMCGISRSPSLISSGADIYEIGLKEQSTDPFPCGDAKLRDEIKWACDKCTYMNYSKNEKCFQCLTQKPLGIIEGINSLSFKKTPSNLSNNLNHKVKTKDSQLGVQGNNENDCKDQANPNHKVTNLSPTSFQEQPLPTFKWRCRGCTYENWPRSSKCVMCGTNKGFLPAVSNSQPARLATPPPPSGNNSKELKKIECDDYSTCNEKNDKDDESRLASSNLDCKSINEINKSMNEKNSKALNAINQSTNTALPSHSANRLGSPVNSIHQQMHQPSQSISIRPGEGAIAPNNYETELILRQLRRRLRDSDWMWLNACVGVVEGNFEAVHTYLSSGGDPMRQLSKIDIKILARPSAFDEGHTLVHLAIRFGREDLLATILSRMEGACRSGIKRVPSYVAPDLASDVRRQISNSIKQRKGNLACHFVTDLSTFSLPADIEELPSSIQEQLFEEILDRDAQKQLEDSSPIINWSLEITDRLGSRLYALWNRSAGDCLLDSVLQAAWGVFDRDGVLRRALAESLSECAHMFYPRWKEYERWQARLLNYYVTENQILEEWTELLCLASQPGAALEQVHVFVLSHVLRRPIIVYGVKCVKSFRGEDLGYARFEGVYLPLLWDSAFCWKSPLALGYTRGHFSALVPIEPVTIESSGAGAILDSDDSQVVFLPLMTHDAKLLPVHFTTNSQVGFEENILRSWLEVRLTEGGILVAQQRVSNPPLAVSQMTQEWLNHYRRLAQMECAPFTRPISTQGYSSDGDSDEE